MNSSLYVRDDCWTKVQAYRPRLLDSVILKAGEKEDLIHDVKKFIAAKNRYHQLGVPYHCGYLFYGPPGTGKTSLVSALAATFGMSIYSICLTDFNDKTLLKAVADVPPASVIPLEDIDCMRTGKARPTKEDWARDSGYLKQDEKADPADRFGVTLSGLLNVVDGFNTPENILFVMTTNNIDTLDPALLRPGRIDYRLYLGVATEEQKLELYGRFFPNASTAQAKEFVKSRRVAETMAEFQGLLLRLEQNPPGDRQGRALPKTIKETCNS